MTRMDPFVGGLIATVRSSRLSSETRAKLEGVVIIALETKYRGGELPDAVAASMWTDTQRATPEVRRAWMHSCLERLGDETLAP